MILGACLMIRARRAGTQAQIKARFISTLVETLAMFSVKDVLQQRDLHSPGADWITRVVSIDVSVVKELANSKETANGTDASNKTDTESADSKDTLTGVELQLPDHWNWNKPDDDVGENGDTTSSHDNSHLIEFAAQVDAEVGHVVPQVWNVALVEPEEDTKHGVGKADETSDIDRDAERPPGGKLMIEHQERDLDSEDGDGIRELKNAIGSLVGMSLGVSLITVESEFTNYQLGQQVI